MRYFIVKDLLSYSLDRSSSGLSSMPGGRKKPLPRSTHLQSGGGLTWSPIIESSPSASSTFLAVLDLGLELPLSFACFVLRFLFEVRVLGAIFH